MSNSYIDSRFYRENYNWWNASWMHGTQKSRRKTPWGRKWRRLAKSENAYIRNRAKSLARLEYKKVSIDSDEELIEKIETRIVNAEKPRARWYWFD